MILLTRENYQRLMSKQEEEHTAQQTAHQAAHQTAQPQKANEIVNDDDDSQGIANSEQAVDNPVYNRKTELLFQVPDQLIKDISSTKTIGKLMSMWLFVKNNIKKGQLRVDDHLQLVGNNNNVLQNSNIVNLIRFFILSPRSRRSPVGYKQFLKLLKRLHLPKHFMKRIRRKKKVKTKIHRNALFVKRKAVEGIPGMRTSETLASFY